MNRIYTSFLLFFFCLSALFVSGQDGQLDPNFNTADAGNGLGDGPYYAANALQQQPDGKIILGGNFSTYNSQPARFITRINQDGSLDNSFSISGFNGAVYTLALQPDGKILAGGYFSSYAGRACAYIARLNSDGTLDTTFITGSGFNGVVFNLQVQPDGKVLVGGGFTTYQGAPARYLIRLNTDGSRDNTFSTGAGPDARVTSIKMNAAGDIFASGFFTSYDGNANFKSIVKLSPAGVPDPSFFSGSAITGTILDFALQADGRVVIGGSILDVQGRATGRIARLLPSGRIDVSFDSQYGFDSTVVKIVLLPGGDIAACGEFADYYGGALKGLAILDSTGGLSSALSFYDSYQRGVGNALLLQADGKLLYGGAFNYNGRKNLVRFNADYSSDENFNKGNSFDAEVNDVDVQADGSIIACGDFSSCYDLGTHKVARLSADGRPDPSFRVKIGPTDLSGAGYAHSVLATATQPDGKVLIAGIFASYDNIASRRYLVRVHPDGALDTSFHPSTLVNGQRYFVSVMSDGRILAGGFTIQNRGNLVRLMPNGSEDTSFSRSSFDSYVNYFKMLDDGRIYVCGTFTTISNSTSRARRILRLLPGGARDETFVSNIGANGPVYSLDVQPDGKVVIAGEFTTYNNIATRGIARLNADGSLDSTFRGAGADSTVSVVRVLRSGKILAGGSFRSYGGQTAIRLMRLNADGSLDQTFSSGSGPNDAIQDLEVNDDGSAIICGYFTSYNGTGRNRIARILNAGPAAVSDIKTYEAISLYPNPAHGSFSICAYDKEIQEVSLYDITGRELLRDHPSRRIVTIPTVNYAPGTYIVSIRTAEGVVSRKVVVE